MNGFSHTIVSRKFQLRFQMKTLPNEFSSLEKLCKLDLSFNRLTEVPRSLCQPKPLECLNIRHNQLNDLPSEMYALTSLRRAHAFSGLESTGLWVDGNPLRRLAGSVWQCSTTRPLWRYLRQRQLRQESRIQPIRIFVLGQSNSGKSTFIRRIVKHCHTVYKQTNLADSFRHDKAENVFSLPGDPIAFPLPFHFSRCRTPSGLDILLIDVTTPPYPEVYQVLQCQLFDKDSLFVITFDVSQLVSSWTRTTKEEINLDDIIGKWLRVVFTYAPSAVVKLVATHVDCVSSSCGDATCLGESTSLGDIRQRFSAWYTEEIEPPVLQPNITELEENLPKLKKSQKHKPSHILIKLIHTHVAECIEKMEEKLKVPSDERKIHCALRILPEISLFALEPEEKGIIYERRNNVMHKTAEQELNGRTTAETAILDEFELRFLSSLFAHRCYEVPVCWEVAMSQLKMNYSYAPLVIIDVSPENNDTMKHCEEYVGLTPSFFNHLGVTDISGFLSHYHSTGDILRLNHQPEMPHYVTLEPTRFLSMIVRILCPDFLLLTCETEQTSEIEKKNRYLRLVSGVTEPEVSLYLQQFLQYRRVNYSMIRALLPAFSPKVKAVPTSDFTNVRKYTLGVVGSKKSPPSRLKKIRETSKPITKDARKHVTKRKVRQPESSTRSSWTSGLTRALVILFANLLEVGFLSFKTLTPLDSYESSLPSLYLPPARNCKLEFKLNSQVLVATGSGVRAEHVVTMWFPLLRPWGIFRRLCSRMGNLLSGSIHSISFTVPEYYSGSPERPNFVPMKYEIKGEFEVTHPSFTLRLQQCDCITAQNEKFYGIRLMASCSSETLLFQAPYGCENRTDLQAVAKEDNSVGDLDFCPFLWFNKVCTTMTFKSEGLIYFWDKQARD
ncbi:unnamed protein product [Dicrocoelium dendriticum]|nr:unnamed protein product [Dicrocoelium dendriticum]